MPTNIPPTNPRRPGGDIAGPIDDPHARAGVVVDASKAVLLDDCIVTVVEPHRGGQAGSPVLGMLLAGRINKTTERARILYLFDEDGAAAIVSELLAMAHRQSPAFFDRLMARVERLTAERAV